MTVPASRLGICSTCNHLEGCSIRRDWEGAIFFCEEFDDYLPPSERSPSKGKKGGVSALSEEHNTGKHKGLCVNCDLRETCALPKSEEGIWHCEEYE